MVIAASAVSFACYARGEGFFVSRRRESVNIG